MNRDNKCQPDAAQYFSRTSNHRNMPAAPSYRIACRPACSQHETLKSSQPASTSRRIHESRHRNHSRMGLRRTASDRRAAQCMHCIPLSGCADVLCVPAMIVRQASKIYLATTCQDRGQSLMPRGIKAPVARYHCRRVFTSAQCSCCRWLAAPSGSQAVITGAAVAAAALRNPC